jgi:hypothetical protein
MHPEDFKKSPSGWLMAVFSLVFRLLKSREEKLFQAAISGYMLDSITTKLKIFGSEVVQSDFKPQIPWQ